MRHFRFTDYDRDNLARCGRALLRDISQNKGIFATLYDTRTWTDFVLDWFTFAAPLNVYTYAHAPRAASPWRILFGDAEIAHRIPGPRHSSEFLLDLTHVTLDLVSRPDRPAHAPLMHRVLLGLESEWGHETSPSHNMERVLYDASKLASVRAKAKVLLFASTSLENRNDIVERVQLLRTFSQDVAPWLWIDLPWSQDRRTGRWDPTWGVEQ